MDRNPAPRPAGGRRTAGIYLQREQQVLRARAVREVDRNSHEPECAKNAADGIGTILMFPPLLSEDSEEGWREAPGWWQTHPLRLLPLSPSERGRRTKLVVTVHWPACTASRWPTSPVFTFPIFSPSANAVAGARGWSR